MMLSKLPFLLLLPFAAMMFSTCKEDAAAPIPTQGALTLNSEYSRSAFAKSGGAAAVDSITISRARFVIRDVRFHGTGEDSTNFKAGSFVLELDLTGTSQKVSVADVKFGTYQRIDFDVHRIEKSELAGRADTAAFSDFLKDERYSVIISGKRFSGGKDTTFTYRSKIDVRQKITLNPALVVSEQIPAVTAALQVSSSGWFVNGGSLLDPLDKNNEGKIDENIKASIRVKKK